MPFQIFYKFEKTYNTRIIKKKAKRTGRKEVTPEDLENLKTQPIFWIMDQL